MSVKEQMVEYYTNLANAISDFSSSLNIETDIDNLSEPALKVNTELDVEQLRALEVHYAPSKALFLHMQTISQAIHSWRYFKEHNQAPEFSQTILQYKENIHSVLQWFQHEFIGQLYAEIDAHWAAHQIDDHEQSIQSIKKVLIEWQAQLKQLAGDDFNFKESTFSNIEAEILRLESAHQRMAQASQQQWLAENAQQALLALRGKIEKFTTISSIAFDELAELRDLYKRFQPYITLGLICGNEEAEKLDQEICYALEGKTKDGAVFKVDKKQAAAAFKGLGSLATFRNGSYSSELDERVQKDVDNYRLLAGSDLSDPRHFNVQATRDVLARIPLAEFSSGNRFQGKSKYQSLNAQQNQIEGDLANLFDKLKVLEVTSRDLDFARKIAFDFAQLIANYNSDFRQSISDNDLTQMQNYLQLLSWYCDDVEPSLFNELQAYLNNESPQNKRAGDYYRKQLLDFSKKIATSHDAYQQLIKQCKQKLTSCYAEEIKRKELQAASNEMILRVDRATPALLEAVSTTEKEIKFSFERINKQFAQGVEQDRDNFLDQQIYTSSSPQPFEYKENYGYLVAEQAFEQLHDAAALLIASQIEAYQDRKLEKLRSVQWILFSYNDLYTEITEDSPALHVLAKQLQDYYDLIKVHFPFNINNPSKPNPMLFEMPALPQGLETLLSLPKQWLVELNNTHLTFESQQSTEDLQFESCYEDFIRIQAELESGKHANLTALSSLMPKLLAIATKFEIENNYQIGSVSEQLYKKLLDTFNNIIHKMPLSSIEKYDLAKNNQFITQTTQYLTKALLVQPRAGIAKLEDEHQVLTEFLAALEKQNAFWFTDKSRVSIFGLTSVHLPTNFNSRSAAEYLEAQREVGRLYQGCFQILDPEGDVYKKDFLRGKPSYKDDLAGLIKATKQRIGQLSQQIDEDKFSLSIAEELTDYYQEKQQRFDEIKKIECKRTLSIMANRIMADPYLLHLKRLSQYLLFESGRFLNEATDAMTKQVETLVELVSSDDKFKDDSGKQLFNYFKQQLEQSYQQQLQERIFYQRLESIQNTILEFEVYLAKPDWCVESETTTDEKNKMLKALKQIIKNQDKSVKQRFQEIEIEISSTGFKENLIKGIEPHYTEVLDFVCYWLMKMLRTCWTTISGNQQVCTKDILADKLYKAAKIEGADPLSGIDELLDEDTALAKQTSAAAPSSSYTASLFRSGSGLFTRASNSANSPNPDAAQAKSVVPAAPTM